jgi:serine/threonine-protein kinase
MSPDQLQRLSTLLDEALDLAEPARQAWLEALQREDAELGATLRNLLAREAQGETAELLRHGLRFKPAASPDFGAGDSVGPYRLLREIGSGGMGEVWLAERADGQLKRQVALKLPILGLRRAELVQRFARERDILASLEHAHIARLYDAGLADDGQPYLALEYVEGEPITAYCDTHALDASARVRLLVQVMDAVQHAHANLVVHRDLKPSNVMVRGDGQAMLLDFGIAKLLQQEQQPSDGTELTQIGGRALTLHCAAPEQIRGGAIGIASDVWALGVLLYELLSGRRPFEATNRSELEQAVLGAEPLRPSAHRAGVIEQLTRGRASELDTIVSKALKKAPAERYATVDAFAGDLQRWCRGEPVRARPDGMGYRLHKFVLRHRVGVALGVVASTTIVGAAAVSMWQMQLARSEAQTTRAVTSFLEGVFLANSADQADPIRARERTARDLLDEGVARIDSDLAAAPAVKLALLGLLARMYEQMDNLEGAMRLYALEVSLSSQLHGTASPPHLQAMLSLARTLPNDEARVATLLEIERVADRTGGLGAAERIDLDLDLAQHYATHGQASACRPRIDRALSKQPAPSSPSVQRVRAHGIQARCLHAGGNDEKAIGALLLALELTSKLATGVPREIQIAHLTDLASLLALRGDLVAARPMFDQAIGLAEGNLGPAGLAALRARGDYADALLRNGRVHEAAEMFAAAREVLTGRQLTRAWAMALSRMAAEESGVLLLLGRIDEALAVAMRGIQVRSDAGVEDLIVLRNAAAAALLSSGRIADAQAQLDVAASLIERVPEKRQTGAAADRAVLQARLHLAAGRPGEALAAWTSWRETSGLPRELPVRATDTILELAELEWAVGRTDDAARHTTAVLDAIAASPYPDRYALAQARALGLRGRAASRSGRHEEALVDLQGSFEMLRAMLDPARSPLVQDAAHSLNAARRSAARAKTEGVSSATANSAGPSNARRVERDDRSREDAGS